MLKSHHSISNRISRRPIYNNRLHINNFKFLLYLRMRRTINREIFILILLISIGILISLSNNLSISRCDFHRILYNSLISRLFDRLTSRVFKSTKVLITYRSHRVRHIIGTISKTVRIAWSIIMIKMIIHIHNRLPITASILIRHLLNNIWRHLLVFGLVAVVVVVA